MAEEEKSAAPSQSPSRRRAGRNRRTKMADEMKSATPGQGQERRKAGRNRRTKMADGEKSAIRGQGPTRPKVNRNRRQKRWMVLKRVARILTQTPDDGTGLVEETPFKKSGVAALMKLLEERMGEEDRPKTRNAKAVHRMLTEGGEDHGKLIYGARVEQLQMMSRMIQRMRRKGSMGQRGRRSED